jgi:TetR/AcrR family transcriptional regulator
MELNVAASPPKITRNPEASRARILEAARIEFVSHGLSGGRVDRIAAQSGVNKNLIYHYFGSKDALYLTCWSGSTRICAPGSRIRICAACRRWRA